MKIKIILKEDKSVVGEFNLRKNAKHSTIISKVKEYINQRYGCQVEKTIPTGTIDFATGTSDISYVLFGKNLPFKNIYLVEEE